MGTRDRGPLLYRSLRTVCRPLVNALWRPVGEGLEHVPPEGPAILASNHLSYFDPVFLPVVCERPIYFLAKAEYFSGPTRWFFEHVGVASVHRQGGEAAEAGLRRGQQLLEEGKVLGIYPEGTRSPDGRLYRGKTGPVRLALRTGAPLLPVAMVGTSEVAPPGALRPRIRRVGLRVGPPLDLSRYAQGDHDHFVLRSATDELMYEIMLLSGQEYVDEYATRVKAGEVSVGSGDLDELGQLLDDEEGLAMRRAS